MKSFITGIDGFIGSWLSKQLIDAGDQVSGLSRMPNSPDDEIARYDADLTDASGIEKSIREAQPDRLFHLAAQSNIPESFANPTQTIDVNVNGTIHLLEALRKHSPQTVFVSVGSSAEYGLTAQSEDFLQEDMPLLPSSPYGISKATQGHFASLYHRAYGLKTVHVRPFAIIGPKKTKDALYDFCNGVIAIENGKSEKLATGNLDAIRDFVDVRDMINWLTLLSEKGEWGETYNMCTGREMNLHGILEILKKLSSKPIHTVLDEKRARPSDDLRIVGNPKKIETIGSSTYSLEDTIKNTFEYWRNQ